MKCSTNKKLTIDKKGVLFNGVQLTKKFKNPSIKEMKEMYLTTNK